MPEAGLFSIREDAVVLAAVKLVAAICISAPRGVLRESRMSARSKCFLKFSSYYHHEATSISYRPKNEVKRRLNYLKAGDLKSCAIEALHRCWHRVLNVWRGERASKRKHFTLMCGNLKRSVRSICMLRFLLWASI